MTRKSIKEKSLNKAVIYARYSSASQNEQTIEGQLRTCNDFAERNKYVVVDTYIDKARSGTNDRRPEFQQMIADAKEKQFNIVIVYTVDRFSRNRGDHIIYKRQLEACGVKVLSAMENIDGDSEEGYMYEGLLEIFSEMYSKKLSKRIKCAFKDSLARGSAWGGIQLLGYKIENKRYVIDETTAPTVRTMFQLIASGTPVKDVYSKLNELGYLTARGKAFTVNSLQHAIRNTRYCGEYVVNGVSYPDRYPAIISKELFYRVQHILSLKDHSNGSGKSPVDYSLSSKSFCFSCGEKIVGTSCNKVNKTHRYYSCSGRWYKKSCDKAHELKDDLEALVAETAIRFLSMPKQVSAFASLASNVFNQRLDHNRIDSLSGEIDDINNRLKELTAAMVKTSVQSILETIEQECEQLEIERTILEAELKRLYIVSDVPHSKTDFENTLNSFAVNADIKNPDYTQNLFTNLINSVFVSDTQALIFLSLFTSEKAALFSDFLDLPTTASKALYADSFSAQADVQESTEIAVMTLQNASHGESSLSPTNWTASPMYDTIPLPKGKVRVPNIIARQLHLV